MSKFLKISRFPLRDVCFLIYNAMVKVRTRYFSQALVITAYLRLEINDDKIGRLHNARGIRKAFETFPMIADYWSRSLWIWKIVCIYVEESAIKTNTTERFHQQVYIDLKHNTNPLLDIDMLFEHACFQNMDAMNQEALQTDVESFSAAQIGFSSKSKLYRLITSLVLVV
jgi:hypothetical protein